MSGELITEWPAEPINRITAIVQISCIYCSIHIVQQLALWIVINIILLCFSCYLFILLFAMRVIIISTYGWGYHYLNIIYTRTHNITIIKATIEVDPPHWHERIERFVLVYLHVFRWQQSIFQTMNPLKRESPGFFDTSLIDSIVTIESFKLIW